MNRRDFFHKIGLGIAGTLVVLKIPKEWIVEVIDPNTLKESVIATLTRAYFAYTKGTGYTHAPRYLIVGRDLMEAFEGELIPLQRYVDSQELKFGYKTLMFKGITMIADSSGWNYQFTDTKPSWLT